jgi:DNA polymerase III sliding clamp (beta) subunit (PCNA family)
MKAIRAVGDDCVLNISDAGIKIRMIDPSNAAMVVVDMAPGSFDAFDADEGDIALDTREVLEKTSTFDDDTVLKISWDGYNKRLIVEGEGAKYGIYTIAPSATRKVPTIPNLDLPLEVEIDAARLRKMIKRAGLVSDHIMMGYTPELEFFVSSEGDLNNFEQGTLENPVKIIYKQDLTTLYSLDMLEPMAKIANELVNIRLGRDLPLIMLFALEDVDITYLLAPRIEKANGTPEA